MLGDISYHKATLQSEGKDSFTFTFTSHAFIVLLFFWLDPWKKCTERPLNFLWTKERLKVLGIHISYEVGNERKNVNQKMDNLNAKSGTWRSRQLSIFGRCLIVKSLRISQIVHSAAVLDIHKDYIVKIQSSINIIWKEKQDKIKREVLH